MIAAPRRPFSVPIPGRAPLVLGPRTLVMGVINVTPDSFSDGGRALDPAQAVDIAQAMQAAGADLIDVGGESTRPGAEPVAAAQELARVMPVLKALAARIDIPISIDTYKAEVAAAALDEGAAIVNDISAFEYDSNMGRLVAARGVPVILMHTRGRPQDMYAHADYGDVVEEVIADLQRSILRAEDSGVSRTQLMVDPGIGFAKKASHSVAVLAGIERVAGLGLPVVIGPSRKSFLTSATGPLQAADRDWATTAAVTAAILGGAHIVRVHAVDNMVHVVRVADSLRFAAGVA
ncbi:MAG TPA: dihydropteroate synthase [Vicinamibacterales bacterium]|nr:dihydropteroate synthase [Vicinamibacterales bacterium]